MSASFAQRWTFTQRSPLGDISASYELTAEGLRFRCDAPIDSACETLRWDHILEAATAVMDLPAGKAGPDMARWIPGRLEWLVVSRSRRSGRQFMRPLPDTEARDAIVAAIRQRLGARWVGERLPLAAARRRFRLSSGGDTLKIVALVLSVIAVLVALLLLFTLVSALLLVPAGIVLGGWLGHRGLDALRDAQRAARLPIVTVRGAAPGPVKLQGRAVTAQASPAGASGVPSAWWDVAVDVWSEDSDGSSWSQVMARHGGSPDMLVLEDATGRVPVWLRGAELLLREHTWESGKDALPAPGLALLHGTAFAWNGRQRIRVRETRMEADGPVVVIGTLDQARRLPTPHEATGITRGLQALRTGTWRNALVRRLPAPLRAPVTIALCYLDMLFCVGRGGARAHLPGDAPPPPLAPSTRVVWRGRTGHSLVVCDDRAPDALFQWRKRSLWSIAIGAAICCFCLYELIGMF